MTNITDGSAVAYSNTRIRPAADLYGKLYYAAKLLISEFTSKGYNTLIPNDTSPMIDGASADGRTPITGADINVLISNMSSFVATAEASSSLIFNQMGKVWVNPR